MGSRRTTSRSSSGNGGSSNGEDMSGSSRPSSCSYLSNVRPENRSTLCSMMAQLTEETQPSFQTTLKSKAVSETCNVKFSCVVTGHPSPQVIWYKDDVQLDRYCGLPKYEIFRNGQNHSLHIYNCTLEDAAIYQASASNIKGIVSCSGVLEVGEMNEFKIHQRYFAKLKQKADNRRREAEGKENQEPLRTISPDRTQRKRRSTMEAFLSMPSSTEDEGMEENHEAVAVETEVRLQEATAEEVEEKPVPITNGVVSAVTNGQASSDAGNKNGTYVYDSAQKIFTAHQPKTPSVKKKIKISSSAKVAKSRDTSGERVSEERKAKEETCPSLAVSCTESAQSEENSDIMEVENIVNSTSSVDSRNVAERPKSGKVCEVLPVERMKRKDANVCAEVTRPSQKEQLTASVPCAAITSGHTVSRTGNKQAAKHEKEAGRKTTEEHFVTSKQLQKSAAAAHQQPLRVSKTEGVTVVDVDEKSNTPTGASLSRKDPVKVRFGSRAALLQHPCEQAGDQLAGKEANTCQENVSVPQPALLSEVTQAHTKMTRNDRPVNLEPPRNQSTTVTQPSQKAKRSERDTATSDIQTYSLKRGLQEGIDKLTQDTWDHSRGSNESHSVLLTDEPPVSPSGGGENNRGCTVSLSAQQSQLNTAIKTVEGTEIQVSEKAKGKEVAELQVQADSVAPREKVVEMETECEVYKTEHTETEKSEAADKDGDVIIMDVSNKETKNEEIEEMSEELSSETPKSNTATPAAQLQGKTPEDTNLTELKDFQEIKKTVTQVVSVAELLRSQIKALDIPVQAEVVQDPTTTSTETCKELTDNESKYKLEVKKPMPDRINDIPPTNLKETLMKIYQELNLGDVDQVQPQDATSPPVQDLQNPLVIPPISVVDTGTTIETPGLQGTVKTYNEGVMDVGQETGALSLVSNMSETVSQESEPPLTVIPTKVRGQEVNAPILEHNKDKPVQDVGFIERLPPEIKPKSKSEEILDQHKMEEHNTKSSSYQNVQEFPSKSEFGTDVQKNHLQPIQLDSTMVEDISKTDSLANPTPEASPSLKRRSCPSLIPSATAQELASGARRKIIPKAKHEEAADPSEAASAVQNHTQKKEVSPENSKLSTSPIPIALSPSLSRRSPLLQPPAEQTTHAERRSPLLNRRKIASETQAPAQKPTEGIHTPKTEGKPAGKDKLDPFKAPQVIRKIRAETFSDASGHLKLWCQFFNVLSDSTIKWYRNEEEIVQIKRTAGDETQVNLAIVQASNKDSGVYGCTITNEYGADSTDCLLSVDVLAGMCLREDLGVGEEIELTPMIFSKGVADSGAWGNKFFGRIMMQESRIGEGCSHKVWKAKVIYGLEPVFESGNTCIIKTCNPIAYGGKGESCLIDRNLDIIKQECKMQNLVREYCKIFSAEARVIENFGYCLEVIPVYLMYRPANTVPYATVEADLTGVYQRYSVLDRSECRIETKTGSQVEQKCCAFQHWIFQWTNGNLLLTQLEGVDTKITNVGISVKSTGHQGLPVQGNPKVFEHFVSQHQCNYFCGLLSLRSLKVMDSLGTPTKPKGSRSPLLPRKMASGSSSPQTVRKAAGSPRLPRKAEVEGRNTPTKQKEADAPKVVKME